jgi:hypothetical protein
MEMMAPGSLHLRTIWEGVMVVEETIKQNRNTPWVSTLVDLSITEATVIFYDADSLDSLDWARVVT